MLNDPVVVVSAARTPMGAFQGELKDFTAPQLGAAAIRAAVERAGIKPDQVEAMEAALKAAGYTGYPTSGATAANTPPEWPAGVRPISLDGSVLFGYWDGKQIVLRKPLRLNRYQTLLATGRT